MDWHRYFGLVLADYFTGTPFDVEPEFDLSAQQQFLDLTVVRKRAGRVNFALPDGFDLVAHNLFTFKSFWEALDAWAMKELIGHSVAYRKLVSPSPKALLPESDFRLFAVCARYPDNLAQQVPWEEVSQGVYNCRWGTDEVRVIVAGRLPRRPENAPLHLFSAAGPLVEYGRGHYRRRSPHTSSLVEKLLGAYLKEGLVVAYTLEDFAKDYTREHLKDLTPQERLEGLPAEERLRGLPAEERLRGLPVEVVEEYVRRLRGAATDSGPKKPARKSRRRDGKR